MKTKKKKRAYHISPLIAARRLLTQRIRQQGTSASIHEIEDWLLDFQTEIILAFKRANRIGK